MKREVIEFQSDSDLQDVLKLILTKRSQGRRTIVEAHADKITVISAQLRSEGVLRVSERTTVANFCRGLREDLVESSNEKPISISLHPGPEETITARFRRPKKVERLVEAIFERSQRIHEVVDALETTTGVSKLPHIELSDSAESVAVSMCVPPNFGREHHSVWHNSDCTLLEKLAIHGKLKIAGWSLYSVDETDSADGGELCVFYRSNCNEIRFEQSAVLFAMDCRLAEVMVCINSKRAAGWSVLKSRCVDEPSRLLLMFERRTDAPMQFDGG